MTATMSQNTIIGKIKKIVSNAYGPLTTPLNSIHDLTLSERARAVNKEHKNPLNHFWKKMFSQSDEDGITLEIVRRLGLKNGTYAEYGVGNWLENNTLSLAALGWRGFWVGGEDLAVRFTNGKKFSYHKEWITLANIAKITKDALLSQHMDGLDVVSLDLDWNDIYFVEELLKNGVVPKLFIVEYNAKFLPPIEFQIDYDEKHMWNEDDYFGASLSSFAKLFSVHDYTLICCNSSGANAFFVKNEFLELFQDVPKNMLDIYSEPRFQLYRSYWHRQSPKTIEIILRNEK